MIYNFDEIISRNNSGCAKWDVAAGIFGDPDILPMWVADMDFPVAAEITEAIKKRAGHEIYGYAVPSPSVTEAVVSRLKRLYGWEVRPEWIVYTPGVVPSLYTAVRAYCRPGDGVLILSPLYEPIWSSIRDNGCRPVYSRLHLAGDRYEIDLEEFESRLLWNEHQGLIPSPSGVSMMILCNPHNPVGRVWTREELTAVGDRVIDSGGIVVSDEIHCELLFRGSRHIPFATLSEKFEQNCIVCMSPSKTFNLAGLGASTIIIPNAALRKKFVNAARGIVSMVNVFGFTALEAAYRHGDEWLGQLRVYLEGNLEFFIDACSRFEPRMRVVRPEGTYLLWLDFRGLEMDAMALRGFIRREAGLGLEDGFVFGPGGEGFQRMNIACPRPLLAEAVKRLSKALDHLR